MSNVFERESGSLTGNPIRDEPAEQALGGTADASDSASTEMLPSGGLGTTPVGGAPGITASGGHGTTPPTAGGVLHNIAASVESGMRRVSEGVKSMTYGHDTPTTGNADTASRSGHMSEMGSGTASSGSRTASSGSHDA